MEDGNLLVECVGMPILDALGLFTIQGLLDKS